MGMDAIWFDYPLAWYIGKVIFPLLYTSSTKGETLVLDQLVNCYSRSSLFSSTLNLGFPAVPTAQCSRLRKKWEIACQQEKVINGNCKWGSNRKVMCAGLPAAPGPRLELLTWSAALRYTRKQKGKSTLMNDTATSPLLYALSFSRSLIHYAAAIVAGKAGRNTTRGKNSNNNRSRANRITAEIVQWHTNKKAVGGCVKIWLNATMWFFTNACAESML